MGQSQKVLTVEIIQIAVVVLRQQVFADLVVATGVIKLVNKLTGLRVIGTGNRQALTAA